jgi:hypothetical protein
LNQPSVTDSFPFTNPVGNDRCACEIAGKSGKEMLKKALVVREPPESKT